MISNNLLKEKIIDTIIQGIDSPIKRISEIASVVSKGTTPRGGNVCYTNNGVLFIRAENIGYGSNNLLNKKFVDIETHENYLKRSILKENDILVSIAGALGRTSFVEKEMLPCNCNQAVAFIRINENIDFIPQYICYCIMSRNVQTSLLSQVKKTAQPNLTLEHIKNIKIPFPTYEEQLEITKKIESLFELIDQKEKNDREKEKLKTLLKDKILDSAIDGSLTDFCSQYSFGIMSDYVDVRDGTHDSPKYVEYSDYPLITSKNLTDKGLDFSNVNYLTEKDYNTINQRSYVDDGDILFAMIGSIGNPVIVNKDRNFAIKNVALFKCGDKIYNKYLYYYLLHEKDMSKHTKGGVQKFVSLKILRNYPIPLPPLEEQHRIVEKIEQCFELIEQL